MKGKERVKTPQIADGDSTLDEVSTVIILDTFILALFSIVMFGTALVLIATHNGLLSSQPSENFYQEQNRTYSLARVEMPQFASRPCGDDSFPFAGPARPDLHGSSVRRGLIEDGGIFNLQRIAPTRSSLRIAAAQLNSIRNAGGGAAEVRIGDQALVPHEQAAPSLPEQAGSGGSGVWNGTDGLYDGYAISTIINNP
jgi:hypothetical protein